MLEPKATIVAIAHQLGLSKTTVSDALNGTGRVSPATVARVRDAAEEAGYVVNRAARALRQKRAGAVGIHLPAGSRELDFYMQFTFGVSDVVGEADLDLSLLHRGRGEERGFHLDGALVLDPTPEDPVLAALLRARVPVVTVGRHRGAGAEQVAGMIRARHEELQREALATLPPRGRRRPVFLGIDEGLPASWALEARAAYEAWCQEHDVEPWVVEVSPELRIPELSDLIGSVVSDGADAIVCCAQGYAAQSQSILQGLGLEPGRDVDLISLAGDELHEVREPRITAVALEPRAYGTASADLLLEVMARPQGSARIRNFDGAHVVPAERSPGEGSC
ncbi:MULTISPECIES: LacI family DNA-binding transcriptional regulator [Actinomycetes]|uniref:LacI family DNA-binding transcriptional regulator n=2 Tax=Actinomycetes TaxID=1760 RepID=A0ABP6LXK9_9MICC